MFYPSTSSPHLSQDHSDCTSLENVQFVKASVFFAMILTESEKSPDQSSDTVYPHIFPQNFPYPLRNIRELRNITPETC